jgi:integrase
MSSIRVRETAYGTRHDVRYRSNGQQSTKTFQTRSDAMAFKRKIDGDEIAGLVTNRRGGERLFGDYADAWLKHRLVRGRPLTPATRQGYTGLLRRHLKPAFGQTKLRQITPERVRLWHSELRSSAPDQAAKAYRLLRAILNTAVADDLLGRNPCTIRGGGIEHSEERPMLQTATVLRLSDQIVPRLRCLVLLGGFSALRTGVLLGLERRDIDPLHGTLSVVRQAQEVTGQGRILAPPKSDAGRRTISLPSFVLKALEDHLRDYVGAVPDSPVFTRPSGLPLRRQDLSRAWTDVCIELGLEGTRVHDLRHHAATLIARNPDTTLRELMATIGHSSHVAALRYQHSTAERNRAIADYLDDVISSAKHAPGA